MVPATFIATSKTVEPFYKPNMSGLRKKKLNVMLEEHSRLTGLAEVIVFKQSTK